MKEEVNIEIGQRFANLVVMQLYKAYNHGKTYLCKCDCGNVLTVRTSDLVKGRKLSCGCRHGGGRQIRDRSDLIGKRFNKLVVLDTVRESNRTYCICQCDCGNIVKMEITNLLRDDTMSCGCYRYSEEQSLCAMNNSKAFKNNRHSSHKGVSYNERGNNWCSQIGFNHIKYYLGCFKYEEDAIAARELAEKEIKEYGEVIHYAGKRSKKV